MQTKSNCHQNQRFEVADIFRLYGDKYRNQNRLSKEQLKVMSHIADCRTAAMGGHTKICNECGFQQNFYNSCRNRHCPKCQTMVKEKWLNDRKAELLPCSYFHNVFTLPHDLNNIILYNRKVCFNILFMGVKETLQVFAKDPQWRLSGQLGFIAVLHTWSQLLLDHFHLHCLIPAGALSFDKTAWRHAGKKKKYLFKIGSLSKEFKKRYLDKLKQAFEKKELNLPPDTTRKNFAMLIKKVRAKQWIAYTKRPFAGPEQVLEYLGRYTHRVAISNNRIKAIDNGKVTFTYKDRKNNNKIKETTITAEKFIHRFLLHVLPERFVKIRYYGFLAHTNKNQSIPIIFKLINPDAKMPEKIKETICEMMFRLTGTDITLCPECKKGKFITSSLLPAAWNTS